MGQCCTRSYDFQTDTETNIPKERKEDDTLVYQIRRIRKGEHIILPHKNPLS
jgi:hypothetical protein